MYHEVKKQHKSCVHVYMFVCEFWVLDTYLFYLPVGSAQKGRSQGL